MIYQNKRKTIINQMKKPRIFAMHKQNLFMFLKSISKLYIYYNTNQCTVFLFICCNCSSNGREARNRAEKNRRDKLNKSIQELAGRVRNVAGSSKRIDKTGILRFSAHGLRIEYGNKRFSIFFLNCSPFDIHILFVALFLFDDSCSFQQ